jgi:hypothetical protein
MYPQKQPRLPGGDTIRWTNHVQRKMQFYGLTPSRVLRIVRAPQRMETGVAEGTLAGMQTAGTKAKPWELWAMWRDDTPSKQKTIRNKSGIGMSGLPFTRKVIITAWRYPGVSPVRGAVPIPADVLAELEAEGEL